MLPAISCKTGICLDLVVPRFGQLDKALAAEKDQLDREIARRRAGLDAVKARHAVVAAIGATCADPWRRFEICTTAVLAAPAARLDKPRP
uniref:Uncharacterized protein n=1 Tax=Bosea sp. NBC_00436 TaxID=2969620 RepID=A0A9E7ZJ98_9HYPH